MPPIDDNSDHSFEYVIESTLIPGATGPLPSHTRLPGGPVITVGIPPIRIRYRDLIKGTDYTRTFSRVQIARETGLSLTAISRLFTGSRKPSVRVLTILAAYFKVPMERMLNEILPRWEMKSHKRPVAANAQSTMQSTAIPAPKSTKVAPKPATTAPKPAPTQRIRL